MEEKNISRRQFFKKAGISIGTVAAVSAAGATLYYAGNFRGLKTKAMNNLLKMGHCAPTVLKTHLGTGAAGRIPERQVIAAASGLPGGIGNLGAECGGVTGSLMYLGLLYQDQIRRNDFTGIIYHGDRFLTQFCSVNGDINCRNILKKDDMPACVKAIYTSPDTLKNTIRLPVPKKQTHPVCLAAALQKQNFHCLHDVFNALNRYRKIPADVYSASWPFIGGTLFRGNTCGALIAGIMALGLDTNKIENSYTRTFKMIRLMMAGDEKAMADETNHFNISINKANKLAAWFVEKYGPGNCKEICGINFSKPKDAAETASLIKTNCSGIARAVAGKTAEMFTG